MNPRTRGPSTNPRPSRSRAQASKGAVKLSDLPAIGQFQAVYGDFLGPQLAGSRLAPFVVNVGRHIPGLGSFSRKDLPKSR